MADVNAEIGVSIDTSGALSQLKALQREIARFHTSVAKSSESAALAQRDLQRNFVNGVNAISGFSAELRTVKTTAESFTDSLEKNKFSMREYFRYSVASTKTFGRTFRTEFDTINKVALENVKRLQTQYIKMGRDASGAMKAIAIMPTRLDLKDFGTQTQIAAQKQALFNQLVRQGSTNLLNFGKNTQWAGRQLMVGFTLPLVGLGAAASKTFMEMETAAIKFRKVYGDLFTPIEEREKAFQDIQELGREFTKYGIAVSETINLAADAAAAGFQGLDLQRQVTEATRLQVLGQLDQQKALETTISLQNAFQLQSTELAEAINFLNAVENQTVVALDDITTAIPKAAPTVRELGGDVKDLAFFMAAMKEGGINAAQGANALKSGLASLINPSDKAREFLNGFGIDVDKIVNKNAGNLKQTVIEFAQELDSLTDLDRQRAIEQLFGKFQLARLSTLFTNVIKEGNQASRVLDLAGSSVEELASLANGELGITANSAMNKFRSSVENLKASLAPVGQIFLEIITPFLENIGKLFDKFNNLSAGTKKVITALVIGIGAIAPVVLMTVGLFANFVANGIKGLMLLRNGYLRLSGQSKILSEQTNYLSVEQQQALAAAASLEQSHMRLEQVFTGEASAVRALVAEYQRMIAAQNTAAARFPTMMQPSFKAQGYAKGIVSVPGPKGAGDVVPAMLSPGESVIPADMTKKYAGLIQGMVAGNIPGYQYGLSYGGKQYNIPITSQGAIDKVLAKFSNDIAGISRILDGLEQRALELGSGFKLSAESLKSMLDAQNVARNNPRGSSSSGGYVFAHAMEPIESITDSAKLMDLAMTKNLGELQKYLESAAKSAGGYANVMSNFGFILPEGANKEKMSPEDVAKEFQGDNISRTMSPVFHEYARSIGMTLDEALSDPTIKQQMMSDINQFADAIYTEIRKVPTEFLKDPDFYAAVDAAEKGLTGKISSILTNAIANMKTPTTISTFGGELNRDTTGQRTGIPKKAEELRSELGTAEGITSYRGRTSFYIEEGKQIGLAIGHSTAQGIIQGAKEVLKSQSPSEEMKNVGRDGGRGLILGAQEYIDDAKVVGQQLASSFIGPPATVSGMIGQGIVPGPSSPLPRVTDGLKEFEVATAQAADITNKTSANISKWNRRLMSGTFMFSSVTGVLSLFGKDLGKNQERLFKLSSAMFVLQGVIQAVTQAELLRLATIRAGNITALMGAKNFTSLFVKGGGLASLGKNLATFGKFATRFLGLSNPIGWVVTGFVVLGGALYKYNKMQEEARKKIEGLGEAASAAGAKVQGLAEYFGITQKKFATETYNFEAAGSGLLPSEQASEVEKLTSSKAFEAYEDDVKAIKNATKKEATLALQSLSIGLETKGFAKDQIEIIIQSILQEAGRNDIVIDFNSLNISSKEGKKLFNQTLDDTFNTFNKRLAKGVNDSFKKSLTLTGNVVSNAFNSLRNKFTDGTISATEYAEAVNNINSKILGIKDSAQQAKLVDSVFKAMGPEAQKAAEGITDLSDKLLVMQAVLMNVNSEWIKVLGDPQSDAILRDIARRAINKDIEVAQTNLETVLDLIKKRSGGGDGKGLTLQEKLIKIYQRQIKGLEQKAKALKAVNDQISRQNDFIQTQMDLQRQITEAKISGNYLEAAALSQQKLMEQSEYNRESREIELQKRIDRIQERIDQLEDKGKNAKLTQQERRLLKFYEGMFKNDEGKSSSPTKKTESSKTATQGPTTPPKYDYGKPKDADIKFIPSPPKNLVRAKSYSQKLIFDKRSGRWFLVDGESFPPNTVSYEDWSSGKIRRYNIGGKVSGPGTGTSDSIPAYLSDGEYVIKEKTVSQYGVPFFDALNAQKFKDGGPIGKVPHEMGMRNSGISQKELAKTNKNLSYYNPAIDDKISGLSSFMANAFSKSPFGTILPIANLGLDVLKSWFGGKQPTFGKRGFATDLNPSTYAPIVEAIFQAMAQPFAEIAKGSGTKGDWLNAATFYIPSPGKIASVPSLASKLGPMSKIDSMLPSLSLLPKQKYKKIIDSIYKRKDITLDENIYPSYTLGTGEERFAFQGYRQDFSKLSDVGVRVVPTTPEGILKEAIRLNPKDKNLKTLLNNFESKKYGNKENEFLDNMVASISVGKRGKNTNYERTDGFAIFLASLIGDSNAKQVVDEKTLAYHKILKDQEKVKKQGVPFGAKDFANEIDVDQIPVIHSTKYPVVRDKNGDIFLATYGEHTVGTDIAVPRGSLHTTLEAPVESHMFGQWDSTQNKIVAPLSSMVRDNDLPYIMNSIDTFWMKSPGQRLKISGGSLIMPFTNEASYQAELIKRGLLSKGKAAPFITVDPKTKDILHLVKKTYSPVDRFQISKMSEGLSISRFETFPGSGKMIDPRDPKSFIGNESELLDIVAMQLAKKQIGIESSPTKIDGWGLSNNAKQERINSLAEKYGIPTGIHSGSAPELLERAMNTRGNLSESTKFYGDNIEGIRLSALMGRFRTNVEKVRSKDVFDDFKNGGYVSMQNKNNRLQTKKQKPYLFSPPAIKNLEEMTLPRNLNLDWINKKRKNMIMTLPKFETGIDNVPYDMPALLHQGERVLTKEENKQYGNKTIINNNNFEITGDNPKEITRLVMLELEKVSNKNNKSNRVMI